MAFGEVFLRDTAGSLERARWLHLARSGSQSHCVIWFILPTRGANHIIMYVMDQTFFPLIYGPSSIQMCALGNKLKGKKQGSVTYSTDQENKVRKVFVIHISSVCLMLWGTISIHAE